MVKNRARRGAPSSGRQEGQRDLVPVRQPPAQQPPSWLWLNRYTAAMIPPFLMLLVFAVAHFRGEDFDYATCLSEDELRRCRVMYEWMGFLSPALCPALPFFERIPYAMSMTAVWGWRNEVNTYGVRSRRGSVFPLIHLSMAMFAFYTIYLLKQPNESLTGVCAAALGLEVCEILAKGLDIVGLFIIAALIILMGFLEVKEPGATLTEVDSEDEGEAAAAGPRQGAGLCKSDT